MQIRLAQAWYMWDQLIWDGKCSDVYWNSNPIVIPSMQSISEDLQSWTNGFSLKNRCLFTKASLGNFKAICHLPFWFWMVIHDTSSIELYQLCVIWWQPMSGLTTAWQQISGSFMTITAWRGRLRRLMKELGDSWATASWLTSWDLDGNCISACVSFVFNHFFISVIEKSNVPSVVCCWKFSNGFLNLKVKIFQNNNSKSPWETNGPNFKEPLQ